MTTTVDVRIQGDSMWPTLCDGDVVPMHRVDPLLISAGDIVMAQHPLKPSVMVVKRVLRGIQRRSVPRGGQPRPAGK